jgi:hypothetical protein
VASLIITLGLFDLARPPALDRGSPMDRPTALVSRLAPHAFRFWAVAAQAATIVVTWHLWQVRDFPPLLPVGPLPQFSLGWPLLASLAVVLFWPGWGVALHVAIFVVSVLMDQTRLQPEVVSGCFLMLATLPAPAAKLLGRMHLVSLWFFSGFHKLLSPGYFELVRDWMYPGLFPNWPKSGVTAFAVTIASVELLLGLLALFPRTRRLVGVLAVPFHLGVVASLIKLDWWNTAVWPWNIALAGAGLGLIYPWRESLRADFAAVRPMVRVAAILLLLSPLGYYIGVLDAYLAHCLYSSNIPRATWQGRDVVGDSFATLNVPLPPTHRTFEAYFHALAKPGETMEIHDPRWCARFFGYAERRIEQPPADQD